MFQEHETRLLSLILLSWLLLYLQPLKVPPTWTNPKILQAEHSSCWAQGQHLCVCPNQDKNIIKMCS